MTDPQYFADQCAEVASQLDGKAERIGPDAFAVVLANEREGLRVSLRRGYGSQYDRVLCSIGLTAECQDGADYREPVIAPLYRLKTTAAIARGSRTIAAQVETKLIAPALPHLEAWMARKKELAADHACLQLAVARWQKRFPTATIELRDKDTWEASFRFSGTKGYAYGRINRNGGMYFDRVSSVTELDAVHLVESLK